MKLVVHIHEDVVITFQTTYDCTRMCGLDLRHHDLSDIASDQRLVIKVQRHAVYRHSCQTLSDDRVDTR